jgi:lipopolysaccharide transport system permease protein
MGLIDNRMLENVTEPTVVIEPSKGLFDVDFKAIWQYRELLYFLVWRDLKIRYKQTAMGVGWVVLQPLVTMIIFTVIFGHFAKIPSDGLPYPVFSYCALLPWNYFATALQRCVNSIVGDAALVSKVYFPRLILPIVGTMSGLFDFAISFLLLLAMMVWYNVSVTWSALLVPFFIVLALATALAVGLWLSALNVRYRDVGFTIPFVIQAWMFASPVVYPVSIVPEKFRLLYSLNPMVGVIEGVRGSLLGKGSLDFGVLLISVLVVSLLLFGGLVFFRNVERTFADNI